jgi:hypothetical protein
MAYAPGPFLNLRPGSYWTSTDLPGHPEQAMAQDFVDGGQNPFYKTRSLCGWAVRDAGQIVLSPETPLIYGQVSRGPNAGALLLIDSQNGVVSIIGNTGLVNACSIAFDRMRLKIYLNPCFGQTEIQEINTETCQAISSGVPAAGAWSITHRHTDNGIYGVDSGPTLLRLDTAPDAPDLTIVGMIAKRSVGGIATRPSDGQLFGVGITDSNVQVLLKLTNVSGSGARDTDVGVVTGAAISGLAFHPDGRLLATDGSRLLTLDASSGAILSSVPFSGPSVGAVAGLAISGPRIESRPDAWLRDCIRDLGTVPSHPSPCVTWNHSPDIIVDNNGDGRPDVATISRMNSVSITVRNRGLVAATSVVVRLYSCAVKETEYARPSLDKLTLVGIQKIDVGIGTHNTATTSIRWRPTRLQPGYVYCLYVVLDHPADPPANSVNPVVDNDKAMTFPEMRQ